MGDSAVSIREFNVKVGILVFSLEWRITLFTLLLVPALLWLGFWQLDRADEKRQLSDQFDKRIALSPLTLSDALVLANEHLDHLRDRRIQFQGTASTEDYLLLDNKIHRGQFGYELITYVDAGAYRVPVNVGWLAGDPARRFLPDVALPSDPMLWTGRVYAPVERMYTLEDQQIPEALPAVIQSYEAPEYAETMGALFAKPVPGFMVRIDASHPAALIADWPVVNQSPQKHRGYAIQWFSMAGVLICAFVLRSSNIGPLVLGRRPIE